MDRLHKFQDKKYGNKSDFFVFLRFSETRVRIEKQSKLSEIAVPTLISRSKVRPHEFKVQIKYYLVHFLFGSAVERSVLDKQSVSSNRPVSACLPFFLLFLLYCCTIVHTCMVNDSWLVGR